ncbi:unnamed protein product [Fusarium graminearum]|nr:unnamed protein product [Fusarium graminearum]
MGVAFSPPGQVALCGNQTSTWEINKGELLHTLPAFDSECLDEPPKIAFAANGHVVIATKSPRSITIWDTETGGEIQFLRLCDPGPSHIDSMAFSSNGILAASNSSAIWIGSISKGSWIQKYSLPRHYSTNLDFDRSSGSTLVTDFGVLGYNLEDTGKNGILQLNLQDH